MGKADSSSNEKSTDPLKELLTALATGARAVNGIPVDDEYAFQASFPEFATALQEAQDSLKGIVWEVLEDQADIEQQDDVDDPFLLEQAADLCDSLVEQLEAYLQSAGDGSRDLLELAQTTRKKSQNSFRTMMEGIKEMEKPQTIYNLYVPDNRRRAPFVPRVHPDKPHGITPLDLSLKDGSGWDTRFGGAKPRSVIPEDAVLPKQHVPHPYEKEILSFQYTEEQLQSPLQSLPSLPMPKGPTPLPFTWIDTPEALESLATRLKSVQEIAMDLEAHSYRSFAGFLCLMQISIRDESGSIESFLIDTLTLNSHINAALADPLANPAVVKVFHGAESDMAWLQRDFGLYVVNLFDTGRAARALNFSSASYAYLLTRYFGIQADKSFQLADWRQRPLPPQMKEYAVQDTYYLLTIYDCLRYELAEHKNASIQLVLDVSRKVSLIRYAGESFRPSAYQTLVARGRGSKTEHRLTEKQESVLAALWDWRDKTARHLDESTAFILPNDSLWRLAMSMPIKLAALQSIFQPMPPHLVALAPELLSLIKQASSMDDDRQSLSIIVDEEEDDDEVEDLATGQRVPSSSSAFFKPTPVNDRQRRGMMSPVLGTEALYQQAGWMTPQEVVPVESSTTDIEEKEEVLGKPKRLLSVHASNSQFDAKQVSIHSLDLSIAGTGRGRTADGMATVRAVRESSTSPRTTNSVEDVVKAARQSSTQIRSATFSKEAIPGVLGVLAQSTGSTDMEEEEEEGVDDVDNDNQAETEEEDFVIPRSIREIYKISNRNRRNKKAFSPTPERGVTPTSEKEKEELARAEELLRGDETVGFLFEQSNSPKRPRTKSSGESEGSPAPEMPATSSKEEAKEEDLAFMREIGWVHPHESNESILAQQYGSSAAAEDSTRNPYYDYTPVAMSSSAASPNANPFFSGAALQGGALAAAGSQKQRRPNTNKTSGGGSGRSGQVNRRQERPEKKDGRSFAYRGKR